MQTEQKISKPVNRPTSILMVLLQWLTHLELSGGTEGEQDMDTLWPEQLKVDLMEKGKRDFNQRRKGNEMKKMKQLMKGLAMLLLLLASTLGVWAQTPTSTTPTQEVCPGTEPYLVTPDNPANTFLWSITGGTTGVDWTISSPTTVATDIVWSNPVTPQTYTVTFKEIAATGCYDEVNVVVTVNPKPDAPIASDQTECEQSPIQTLTAIATPPAGASVVWYDAATGGNVVASPELSSVGTITYYAESVLGSCASLTRTAVILTINPAPLAPTASDQTECEQSPVQTLTAIATPPAGATVVWYDAATAGTVVASPMLSSVGTITYYAESELGSCTSLTRTAVVLTIDPAPLAPTASDQTECEKSPVQILTATATPPAAAIVVWYDAATGGTVVANPELSSIGTITYYAESVLGSCTSLTRTAVVLTIDPAPLAPTASDQTECEQTPVQTLTASATPPAGATVVWYDAATGGNVVDSPVLSSVGTITYYAESLLGSCASLTRTAVILTINPAPLAPTASDQTECEKSPVQTLTAMATPPPNATVVWYDAASGGNVVDSPVLSSIGTVTYYSESVIGSCTSPTRTPVTLTIEAAPIPTLAGPSPVCEETQSNVYTTETGMTNYVWVVSAGGTITSEGTSTDNIVTVTWNTAGPQTVSVNYEDANGCSAVTPKVFNVTVNPLPHTSPIFHN